MKLTLDDMLRVWIQDEPTEQGYAVAVRELSRVMEQIMGRPPSGPELAAEIERIQASFKEESHAHE